MKICLISVSLPEFCFQTNEISRPNYLHINIVSQYLYERFNPVYLEIFQDIRSYDSNFDSFDMIALSSYSSYSFSFALEIAKEAKSKGKKVIIGGNHQIEDAYKSFFDEVHSGIVLPATKRVFYTQNLDHLDLYLSAGCPYNCYFCSSVNRKKTKIITGPNISTAIELMKDHRGVINIEDTCFYSNKKYYQELLETVSLENVINIQTRVDILNIEDLKFLYARLPNLRIHFGLERFDKAELEFLNKSRNDNYLPSFFKTINWMEAHNKQWSFNIIVGYPGDSSLRIENNLRKIEENNFCNKLGALLIYESFPNSYFEKERAYYRSEYGTVYQELNWAEGLADRAFLIKSDHSTAIETVKEQCIGFIIKHNILPDINFVSDDYLVT